ncbi:MAG: diguanylate cyclase [Burkholderiaceae bacterium]|nr:MAG: diguanylate cyclase [Burkholderiaceae bacterium]
MEHTLLLVDDNPGLIQVMGRILSGQGKIRFATNGLVALQLMRQSPPDLVLLDAEMPGMNGYEICIEMKADPLLADIPVIFVTAHSEIEFELKVLEIGAVDFISKPISEPLLLARVKTQLHIKRLTDELRRIATVDPLTELVNRRKFDQTLESEWQRSLRHSEPICLLMIDVDHFKLFNDRYGHPAGDDCLRRVARALSSVTQRPADLVARWGGEEFAILLPNTDRAGAQSLAQEALEAVSNLAIRHEDSTVATHVTVSLGIGCYDETSACWAPPVAQPRSEPAAKRTASDLVHAADQALYAAKQLGRARVCFLDINDADRQELTREIA